MTPAVWNFSTLQRGDSIEQFILAQNVRYQADDTPLPIASARMQVRTQSDDVVLDCNTANGLLTIAAGTPSGINILFGPIGKELTEQFPPGEHIYDLELTLTAGSVLTPLKGSFPVDADITR